MTYDPPHRDPALNPWLAQGQATGVEGRLDFNGFYQHPEEEPANPLAAIAKGMIAEQAGPISDVLSEKIRAFLTSLKGENFEFPTHIKDINYNFGYGGRMGPDLHGSWRQFSPLPGRIMGAPSPQISPIIYKIPPNFKLDPSTLKDFDWKKI